MAFATFWSLTASAQSAGYAVQDKDFGKFTTLIVDLAANIEVDASLPSQGTLVASPHDMESISWEVKGSTLIIAAKEGATVNGPVNLILGGAGLARIESTSESVLYVHHLSETHLDLDMLKGTLKLEGRVDNLMVMAEKGKVFGSGLEAKKVEVKVWDEGSVVVNALESLKIEATDNGKVIYNGAPSKIKKNTCGAATIMSQEELQRQKEVEHINFGV